MTINNQKHSIFVSHLTTKKMNEYYMAQIEMEQQALRDIALRMQFEDEQRMELNADMKREMDMERESYEC